MAVSSRASAADVIIDVPATNCQQNVAINNAIGQSFRVAYPTQLDAFEIWMRPELYYVTTYRVDLYDGEGGGTFLGSSPQLTVYPLQATSQSSITGTAGHRSFSFAGKNVTLQANRAYTFKLVRLSQYSGAFANCGNVYAGGIEYWLGYSADASHDVAFRLLGTVNPDLDGDGVPNAQDGCPTDAGKTEPGVCGCGASETDADADGTFDCHDECDADPAKTLAGSCGCGNDESCVVIDVPVDGCQQNVAINNAIGQSFRVTKRSDLKAFEIWMRPELYYVTSYRLDLYEGEGGGTFLGSSAQVALNALQANSASPNTSTAGHRAFSFEGRNIVLQANRAYTFKLVRLSQYSGAFAQCGNVYAGGIEYWLGYSADPSHDVAFRLLALSSAVDTDGDGTTDDLDGCPTDAGKIAAGACGCGWADTDTDLDGLADCHDQCAFDPAKDDAGFCGCGTADVDTDGDASMDCHDECPEDPTRSVTGVCGCGADNADTDGDGFEDCVDACGTDPAKIDPGTCGCGTSDADSDGDGLADCQDACSLDATKSLPGVCGCGLADTDSDGDGAADCHDACAFDPAKTALGICGCGTSDADSDADGSADCAEACDFDSAKTEAGVCGCGAADLDSDDDGTFDCHDGCPTAAYKTAPGVCGCEAQDVDGNGNGFLDCQDAIFDPDLDGVASSEDSCPALANPGQEDLDLDGEGDVCDADDDGDAADDALDNCPIVKNASQADVDFDGAGDACDAHFDGGTVVDVVETAAIEMTQVITSIPTLSGGNGMIAKLQSVVDTTVAAQQAFEAGSLSSAEYAAHLQLALDALSAFDNQLQAKASTKKPQISAAEASLLANASSDLRAWIRSLITYAGP